MCQSRTLAALTAALALGLSAGPALPLAPAPQTPAAQAPSLPLVEAQVDLGSVLDSLDPSTVEGALNTALKTIEANPQLESQLRSIASSIGLDYDDAMRLVTSSVRASPRTTQFLSSAVEKSGDECGKLPNRYRVDCIQQNYETLRDALPRNGDYAAARSALSTVSRELDKIARQNRDRSQPRVRIAGGSRSQSFTAVRDEAALRQAAAVVEKAKQQLLRSVPRNDPRYAHYVRIAAAFDDAAVLLRS